MPDASGPRAARGPWWVLAAVALVAIAAAAFAWLRTRSDAGGRPKSREPVASVNYVQTPHHVVRGMLELARVGKDDVVYDLGSGDGRIVIAAARDHGARAVGIEIDPELVRVSRQNAAAAGVEGRVTFEQGDLFAADISRATVVTLFLSPDINEKLLPKLATLAAGSRVVSHGFGIRGVRHEREVVVPLEPEAARAAARRDPSRPTGYHVYLWTAPLDSAR